ncbi:MAG: hypothetical protein ACREXT_09200 [Gammaproteobacteria bacterium]
MSSSDSVSANRRHYEQAAAALVRADRVWLDRLITSHIPLSAWAPGLERPPGDVKTIITFE